MQAQLAHGGAIPTITVDPSEMDAVHDMPVVRVQTPQGFVAKELLSAYLSAEADSFTGTDTGACIEKYFIIFIRQIWCRILCSRLNTINYNCDNLRIRDKTQEDKGDCQNCVFHFVCDLEYKYTK